PAERTVSDLSNNELIERLPPACQEWVRQPRTGTWSQDPIVVEWGGRILARKVTSDELGRALRACGMLRSSPTCFEGQPYHVWMRMPSWLPGQVAVAKPKLPGLSQAQTRESKAGMLDCGNALAAQ